MDIVDTDDKVDTEDKVDTVDTQETVDKVENLDTVEKKRSELCLPTVALVTAAAHRNKQVRSER